MESKKNFENCSYQNIQLRFHIWANASLNGLECRGESHFHVHRVDTFSIIHYDMFAYGTA